MTNEMPIPYETLELVSKKIDYGLTASATDKNTGTKFLRITDIQDDGVDWKTVPFCACSEADAKQFALEQGDILFARTGSVGKSFVIPDTPENSVFASYLIRVKLDHDVVLPKYLGYFFRTQEYWRQISETAVGGIQLGVNATKLSELRVPLPPLPEQQRIAALLDRADRLRRTRRYAQELSDSFLQAVFVEMFGDLNANNKNLEFARLEDVSEIASGVTKGQKFNGKKTVVVPYLRVANVQDGYLDLSEIKNIESLATEAEELKLQYGDVLMTEGGDFDKLGRGAIWHGQIENCIHQNHIFRVRVNPNCVLPDFFAKFLLMPFAKNYFLKCSKQTSNLATINMTQLKELLVPVPSFPLQQKFARVVQQFERLRAQQREAERQAEHLFQTLLERAFRGEG